MSVRQGYGSWGFMRREPVALGVDDSGYRTAGRGEFLLRDASGKVGFAAGLHAEAEGFRHERRVFCARNCRVNEHGVRANFKR